MKIIWALICLFYMCKVRAKIDSNKDFVLPSERECGKNNVHRIVGGNEAKPHTWPWQVAVYELPYWSNNDTDYNFICGASVINQRFVLCAAHCFVSYGETTNSTKVKVMLGAHNLKSKDGKWYKANKIIAHPKYDENLMQNDVAIIKLDEPIDFTTVNGTIAPICIPGPSKDKENLTNVLTVVTGWGTLTSMGDLSDVLMQVSVPIVSKDECQKSYDKDSITDCNICAGFTKGGKDTCQGDSGGPLCVRKNDRWYQYGITSWGRGCAEPNAPGVYTNVPCIQSWILKTLEKEKKQKQQLSTAKPKQQSSTAKPKEAESRLF